MSQLTTMLNARVAGAWGNDTGDYRGRAPGYFFKLTCVSSGNNVSYTVSYEAFTQSNVYSLASRVRSNTATESDYSLLWRLQTSYGYDIGMNLYREFLFLTDPIHSVELSNAQLQEALSLMKASSKIPKGSDPALLANTFEIYMAYSAALSEMTYDELFGSLHAMSILQAAGGISNFVIDLKNYIAEYRNATSLAMASGNNTYYRAMSKAEYEVVRNRKILRGGRPGPTYFTNTDYTSAAEAQNKLALDKKPEYMMEFKIINKPFIVGGSVVKPAFGSSGGGIEFFSPDEVHVQIINTHPLN
jgi:hypothetical protein